MLIFSLWGEAGGSMVYWSRPRAPQRSFKFLKIDVTDRNIKIADTPTRSKVHLWEHGYTRSNSLTQEVVE